MGFLQGKKILITGMISERSIAYGIAKACHEQGAELAFTYVVDKLEERVRKMAKELGSDLVFRCDVQSDEEIEQAFAALRPAKRWAAIFSTASAAKPSAWRTKCRPTACPRWPKPRAR